MLFLFVVRLCLSSAFKMILEQRYRGGGGGQRENRIKFSELFSKKREEGRKNRESDTKKFFYIFFYGEKSIFAVNYA